MNGLVYGLLLAFSTQSIALIYNKSSIQEIQRHLLSREGVPLIFLFLTVYWKLQLMPFSYYDEDLYLQPVKLYKLLIIQDLMQYVSHRLEHKYHLKCAAPLAPHRTVILYILSQLILFRDPCATR